MSKVLKSKAKMFGECITAGELLEALLNPEIKDEAPIVINTRYCSGFLRMVFRCKSCKSLHFMTGDLSEDERIEALINLEVHTEHYKDEEYVTRGELISLLVEVLPETRIFIQDTYDESTYTLVEVYRCSEECPSVHLDCRYEEDAIIRN